MRSFLMMCMAASAAALQGGPACEASVTLSTARVAHAASLVLKAAQTCNQGMGANCTKEVNDVASAVSGAQKTANATAKECGPTTAACGKDVAVAQTALDNAAPLVSKAQADCSKNEIECNAALVSVGTQLTRAAVGFNQAGKDCKTELGTPVCEAEVVILATRVTQAVTATVAATRTCRNSSTTECKAAVATASAAVTTANIDAKAAVNECGDPNARCGRHVATSNSALEIAVILMINATTVCGKGSIDRAHCIVDLLMVETELARADVFAIEAATMCGGSNAVATKKENGPVCEAEVVLLATRVTQAVTATAAATTTCRNSSTAECKAAVATASAAVTTANIDAKAAVNECGDPNARCGRHVATSNSALEIAVILMINATTVCGKGSIDRAHCIVDLLMVETELARADVFAIEAATMCGGSNAVAKKDVGTPVCEAEVVLLTTRVTQAVTATAAATTTCRNSSTAECKAAVATASAAVTTANIDAKAAVNECGDPNARCGRHVATSNSALEIAVILMINATTVCGKGSIDRAHCIVDLLMVETELVRADVFAIEAATMCGGPNALEKVDTPVCEAEVVLVLTRINDAARDLVSASSTCTNGTNDACKAAVATATHAVTSANTDARRAVGECGDPTARCGRHVATASSSLEIAVILMHNATTTCGRTGIDKVHCRIDLLMVDTEVARAAAFAAEASTMCNGKKAEKVGTAVCEAEVALVLTRVGDAGRDLGSANSACTNGTSAECKSAVAASSTTVRAASTDSKRAVGECGDPTARCGRHVAVADTSLDTAVILMHNATTTCGRTGIDKVHCRIDLLMVDTEVARGAVFAGEAATMCAGKKVGSQICNAAITVGAARMAAAFESVLKASEACTNGTDTSCHDAAGKAQTAVDAVSKAVNTTVAECPKTGTCHTELVASQTALTGAVSPAAAAADKCGTSGDKIACRTDLLQVSAQLTKGAAELNLANKDCKNATRVL